MRFFSIEVLCYLSVFYILFHLQIDNFKVKKKQDRCWFEDKVRRFREHRLKINSCIRS
uniref:Uncharacterized protein n=1 Tax=Aegilops tauschii subsp. strangulata TaxID=200361 RepID=A0A453SZ85_AEGTS